MELIKRPVVQLIKESASEFAKRLPGTTDATKWTMQLATVVQKNPDLLGCDPGSLLLAAYEAAELGVSLCPSLQLGYFIPYKGKVQFQISWRGLVQRAYESGCVRAFLCGGSLRATTSSSDSTHRSGISFTLRRRATAGKKSVPTL